MSDEAIPTPESAPSDAASVATEVPVKAIVLNLADWQALFNALAKAPAEHVFEAMTFMKHQMIRDVLPSGVKPPMT